jgi:hypothetical protein
MDATRARRTRDDARQRWYASWRSRRFARHLGFAATTLLLVQHSSLLRRAG